MGIVNIQKEEFINLISKERLSSYSISPEDNFSILLKRYMYNIKLSETFYPILSVFESVFPNFPMPKEMNKIRFISPDLKTILQLRNRIFHHEIIINHPLGIQNCYSIIEKLLSYMSGEYSDILAEVSKFNDIIKQKP